MALNHTALNGPFNVARSATGAESANHAVAVNPPNWAATVDISGAETFRIARSGTEGEVLTAYRDVPAGASYRFALQETTDNARATSFFVSTPDPVNVLAFVYQVRE
jgi:hypothetical protein